MVSIDYGTAGPSRARGALWLPRTAEFLRVEIQSLDGGERLPLLVHSSTGMPMVAANQYMLRRLRPRLEVTSIEVELRSIATLYTACWVIDIDLDSRFGNNEGLTDPEIEIITDLLRLRADETTDIVGQNTWGRRLIGARDFLLWLVDNAKSKARPGTIMYEHLLDQRQHLDRKITSAIPPVQDNSQGGLESELCDRLSQITHPESIDNPFQEGVRRRNHLVIQGLLTMGPRRGGFLKVRVRHVATGRDPYMKITRERDCPDDRRSREPREKTLARKIPISDELAQIFDEYLHVERRKVPGAIRNPYLLLSRKGCELNQGGINDILDQVKHWYPEFRGKLYPHALRHSASDRFWAILTKRFPGKGDGMTRREILNYIMGWSPTSAQSEKYPRGQIAEAAGQIMLEMQRQALQPIA